MRNPRVKTFADTFIYTKADKYEESIIDFIMKGKRINKNDKSFADIIAQVKRRQVTSTLVKILMSENVILVHHPIPMQKAFKVMCAKDIKTDSKLKVFIDCSAIMVEVNGTWTIPNVDILISYLVNALTTYIYYRNDKALLGRSTLITKSTEMYALMFSHIINYLYKINLLEVKRDRCIYMASVFYQTNILKQDFSSERVKDIAKKISNLSNREVEMLSITFGEDDVINIKTFIQSIATTLKLDKLTVDLFLEKWIYLYGTGTQFGVELFPAFSAMITDAYVGAYLNNQKTIEKIVGKQMVDYTKEIFRVGEDHVR